jgi:hypothetical protein
MGYRAVSAWQRTRLSVRNGFDFLPRFELPCIFEASGKVPIFHMLKIVGLCDF